MALVPGWLRAYQRAWLARDVLAGLIIWGVVVPQATAYAQIAGLPPQAGLVAAPGAMLGYALLGTSRSLVVSATTATSALSLSAVGPLAHGDVTRFAALSAALALVTAAVLALAGWLKAGALADFISKPVMTGFLFGLGLTIMLGQLPDLLGVKGGEGQFFGKLADILGNLSDAHGNTVAVGLVSVAALIVAKRLPPLLPGSLVVLVSAIVLSSILGLADHGVPVVGKLPHAVPDPSIPDVSLADLGRLVAPALGAMILTTEAVGVARALATAGGYRIDANRELVAIGAGNLLGGLSSGFVQSGGASQTIAADRAGGKTELASVVAAVLILLTGAFLASIFENLPQATLAAIVIVSVAGFFDVAELRRFQRLRRSAVVLSTVALIGVLLIGVLPGLLVAAALSLILVIKRLSRPGVTERDEGDVVVASVGGPLFYANAHSVGDRIEALVRTRETPPRALVLELDQDDIDVETLDVLADLRRSLDRGGVELRLANVRHAVRDLLERDGLDLPLTPAG